VQKPGVHSHSHGIAEYFLDTNDDHEEILTQDSSMAIVVLHHSTAHFGNIDAQPVAAGKTKGDGAADVLVGYSVANRSAKTDVQEIVMDFWIDSRKP
jgi:hypothetical protein